MARAVRFIEVVLATLVLAFALNCATANAQTRLPPQGFADLAERLTPAVVNIATSQRVEGVSELPQFPPGSPLERFNQGFDGEAQITSLGSGFVISADGVIVTNNHVIESADSIDVILQSGQKLEATVVGRDPATDIAVLRVHARTPLPYVNLGESDSARVGDLVLAIGNPFGFGGSVSVGIVSARNRNIDAGRYDDFIQTDAAINRGNSGGPLFNLEGEVIGVNTAIVSPTGASVGVGFATPAAIVRPVVAQLLRYGETRRGYLGVRLSNVTQDVADRAGLHDTQGAAITRVTPGGPAAQAGLRAGDIIIAFAGRAVSESRVMTRMVGEAQVGARVPIDVIRDGQRRRIEVVIARLEEPSVAGGGQGGREGVGDDGPRGGRLLGMALSELDAGLRTQFQIEPDVQGLVVLDVEPGGPAQGAMQPGDVVSAIGFAPVDTMADARAVLERAGGNERALVLTLDREGRRTYRSVRVGG
jgi:serine protease Do